MTNNKHVGFLVAGALLIASASVWAVDEHHPPQRASLVRQPQRRLPLPRQTLRIRKSASSKPVSR